MKTYSKFYHNISSEKFKQFPPPKADHHSAHIHLPKAMNEPHHSLNLKTETYSLLMGHKYKNLPSFHSLTSKFEAEKQSDLPTIR